MPSKIFSKHSGIYRNTRLFSKQQLTLVPITMYVYI